MMKLNSFSITPHFLASTEINNCKIVEAIVGANEYLRALPSLFATDTVTFYTTLNQRNLSGFVGELFKHTFCTLNNQYILNPHPDGRPDVLDISDIASKSFFETQCFSKDGLPLRTPLAPYPHGGIEIKASIGSIKIATEYPIGVPRTEAISSVTYWAHHAHECKLMGLYYDFCAEEAGSPQIKAAFFCSLMAADWHKVSIGDPTKKKTSNTSLNAQGITKIRKSLICHTNEERYTETFRRLRYLS